MPDAWNSLESQDRVDRIMRVMVKAATDKEFRKVCVGNDADASRKAIEKEADVTFEPEIVLHRFPDRKTVENQIVLQFPPEDDDTTVDSPVRDYWLCTYVDYIPAKPKPASP
jgi:hypothetical protein